MRFSPCAKMLFAICIAVFLYGCASLHPEKAAYNRAYATLDRMVAQFNSNCEIYNKKVEECKALLVKTEVLEQSFLPELNEAELQAYVKWCNAPYDDKAQAVLRMKEFDEVLRPRPKLKEFADTVCDAASGRIVLRHWQGMLKEARQELKDEANVVEHFANSLQQQVEMDSISDAIIMQNWP